MSRELDQQCARALGWTWDERSAYSPSGSVWDNADTHAWGWLESYSTDPTAARLLEDDIEKRGLAREYLIALVTLIDGAPPSNPYFAVVSSSLAWLILRATPEQRCRAYLKARGL